MSDIYSWYLKVDLGLSVGTKLGLRLPLLRSLHGFIFLGSARLLGICAQSGALSMFSPGKNLLDLIIKKNRVLNMF